MFNKKLWLVKIKPCKIYICKDVFNRELYQLNKQCDPYFLMIDPNKNKRETLKFILQVNQFFIEFVTGRSNFSDAGSACQRGCVISNQSQGTFRVHRSVILWLRASLNDVTHFGHAFNHSPSSCCSLRQFVFSQKFYDTRNCRCIWYIRKYLQTTKFFANLNLLSIVSLIWWDLSISPIRVTYSGQTVVFIPTLQ